MAVWLQRSLPWRHGDRSNQQFDHSRESEGGVVDLGEYALDPLRRDEEFILYRGQHRSPKDAEPLSILLLAPVSQRPDPETVKKLEHEYSLKSELDAAWAVRPLAFSRHKEQIALVLEDTGGQPLDRLIHGPMEIGDFLRIATGLAGATHQLHKRGLIHKDLKPHNVLVDPTSCKVWLTGFGIRSRLPREHPSRKPPEFIAGTLAYMAPEQTGRMNRANLDRIFNAFFTIKSQGTGLGLAITRSIIASYGGRVWATANPGRGASFHFTLPSRVALSA